MSPLAEWILGGMTTHNHKIDHVKLDERDDQQHIQTQKLLALRVIAPPSSRLASILEERFAELYERLGEKIDPAKRRELTAANQDGQIEEGAKEGPGQYASTGGLGINPNVADLNEPTQLAPGGARFSDRGASIESVPRIPKADTIVRERAASQPVAAQQTPWIWVLSQLLKTDLKRLGLEPDELNDIRVFLIKSEAAKYDKLELLSRLPDSLSPEAKTKIFEDIRTLAAGYIAFVMIERVKSQVENGQEVKQMPELPRSVVSPFYGVQSIEFDPEEVLRKLG